MARLSVIIPVYNRAGIVGRTLDSIVAQSYRPLRVILVDNNSTDNTLSVLQAWKAKVEAPDFHVEVVEELVQGACVARNTGLRMVDTEWTMFFDSDDVMHADHCAKAMQTADENPDADVVGWNMLYHKCDGTIRSMKFRIHDMLYNNIMHSTFSTQHYMARTEVFNRVGGWNEQTRIYDDCELGVRIICAGARIVRREGDVMVDLYESRDSITSNGFNRLEAIQTALDAMRDNVPAGCRHWVDLQQLIKISTWRTYDSEITDTVRNILNRQLLLRRWLWRLLYSYSRHGGRGVARIYRKLSYIGF